MHSSLRTVSRSLRYSLYASDLTQGSSRISILYTYGSGKASGILQTRSYASKAKGKQKARNEDVVEKNYQRTRLIEDTGKLIPGSKQVLSGQSQAEYEKADEKMKVAVDWLRREVATMEARGSGRVTPDLLKPVRVVLAGTPKDSPPVPLTDVATVGIRDGTVLIVTVFSPDDLKHVESAIHIAKIPHVVPQRIDNRTIKIPMPRPTVEARVQLTKSAAKLAEDTREQLRRHEQASVKKGKYAKHSVELQQFHELLQKHLKDVDSIISDMKKKFSVK